MLRREPTMPERTVASVRAEIIATRNAIVDCKHALDSRETIKAIRARLAKLRGDEKMLMRELAIVALDEQAVVMDEDLTPDA